MKRNDIALLVGSVLVVALWVIVGQAQGLVARCGTVKNQTDFLIYAQAKSGGVPTPIPPHSARQVCQGR